jgi:DNA-binding NarL/FixJ family response regulator
MTEDRAHRPALSPMHSAAELRRMVEQGKLHGESAEAVLRVAGHDSRARKRRTYPAGLTEREVQVLRLAAQGFTAKQIAERLVISAKTADHHIQHTYAKIGVSTRGAAALFAIEHDLVRPTSS